MIDMNNLQWIITGVIIGGIFSAGLLALYFKALHDEKKEKQS